MKNINANEMTDIASAPWWARFLLQFVEAEFIHTPGWYTVVVFKRLFGKVYFLRAYVDF